MDYAKESLRLHGEWKGKIEVVSKVPVQTKDDLSLAYTPGDQSVLLEIFNSRNIPEGVNFKGGAQPVELIADAQIHFRGKGMILIDHIGAVRIHNHGHLAYIPGGQCGILRPKRTNTRHRIHHLFALIEIPPHIKPPKMGSLDQPQARLPFDPCHGGFFIGPGAAHAQIDIRRKIGVAGMGALIAFMQQSLAPYSRRAIGDQKSAAAAYLTIPVGAGAD